tara:strand:- start:15348 stop:15578 length:231 start_codon:yes stop_codon:yes gene_type:complete
MRVSDVEAQHSYPRGGKNNLQCPIGRDEVLKNAGPLEESDSVCTENDAASLLIDGVWMEHAVIIEEEHRMVRLSPT